MAWIERTSENPKDPTTPPWLHRKLREAARATHQRLGDKLCPVGVDSLGRWTPRYEPLQYAEYGPGGHYKGWHTDGDLKERDPEDVRAITIVVLVSEPGNEFTGGAFECRLGGKNGKAEKINLKAGDAIGFPAKRLEHRVCKTESGLRRSLVFWVSRQASELLSQITTSSATKKQGGRSIEAQPKKKAQAPALLTFQSGPRNGANQKRKRK